MRVLIYKVGERFAIEVYGTNAVYAYCDTRVEVDALIASRRLLVMHDFN